MGKGSPAVPILLVLVVAVGGLLAWIILHPRHSSIELLPPTGKLSPEVHIDVYVDGSGSMKNFLNGGAVANTYKDVLENCEFALTSGTSQGGWDPARRNVQFWKFGPEAGPVLLKGESPLRTLAEDPNQYDAPDTPIETAVNANPPGQTAGTKELEIIITDLYQSEGKPEKVGLALEDQFLKKGDEGAVAIYGVRNPYKGSVDKHDLSPVGHGKLLDAATSMPFYIVIAGENAADVRHAQELLTGGQFGSPLRQAERDGRLFAVYLSRNAGTYSHQAVVYDAHVYRDNNDQLLHFSATPKDNPKPGQEGEAEVVGGSTKRQKPFSAMVSPFREDHLDGISELDLHARSMKDSVVGVSWVKHQPDVDSPILQTDEASTVQAAKWRVRALYCEPPKTKTGATPDKSDTTMDCQHSPLVDEKAAQGVHVCNVAPGTGQAQVCRAEGTPVDLALTIDRSQLAKRRQYLLEIDQVADTDGQSTGIDMDGRMTRWSLSAEEVRQLLGNAEKFPPNPEVSADAHPGKTPNLAQLISALDGYVMSSGSGANDNGVVLKTYYLYLNAR
jgi:hypothetical protein